MCRVKTAVFFHAHPDDEALLTAGTMAMLAAEGHRVVLVVATAGEHGLAELPHGDELGEARMNELYDSAARLGCARVVRLGYADSGLEAGGGAEDRPADAFMDADIEEAATRLAAILDEEKAELLTIYDPSGGYGHPDHVQVYRVGTRAAKLAAIPPILLEATVNRDPLLKGVRLAAKFYPQLDIRSFETAYSASADITHRVNVRRWTSVKRQSMAAHATQASGGDGDRTLAALLKIPAPVYRYVFGTEWYVRRDLPPGTKMTHPFDD